jgi:hypothetical protein
MHKHALKTRESSCVRRAAKPFFIPVVHNPLGIVGHMAAPELPSQEGRAPSHGTHGNTRALLSGRQSPKPWNTWQHRSSPLRKAEPRAMGHVVAPKLPSQEGRARSRGTRGSTEAHISGRRGLEPRDKWQYWSSPQHGGEVQGRGTHGGTEAHLYREVWSEATAYMIARGCTPCSMS